MSSSDTWLGDIDYIETEYVTVSTSWLEETQEWKTLVLVSVEVMAEFGGVRALRILDQGRVVTSDESRRLHKYAVQEVYRGAYRERVQQILADLEPMEVQEDDD